MIDSSEPVQTLPRTDVCIVGAGIAGLVLAQRLAAKGHTVTLLEAGGLDVEERSQTFSRTEMADTVHAGATLGRFRALGGSSTRWGGQLLPYPETVFAPPSPATTVPWPIGSDAIEPYYEPVERLMQVGVLPFTDALLPALGHPQVPFSSNFHLRYSKWAPFHRRNLAQTLGQECIAHSRIHLYTHASVSTFAVGEAHVRSLTVLDNARRGFRCEADHFIVAAGTIESSRLLLASPAIPNPYDQLGRYFHDHLSFHAAELAPAVRDAYLERLGPFLAHGVLHTCKIEASPTLGTALNVMAHLVVQEPEDSGTAAVRNLLVAVQRGHLKQALTRNLLPLLRGLGDVVRLLWFREVRKRRAVSARAQVFLNIDLEQPATPANRIRLSSQVDALGMPLAIVDWRVGKVEYDTARTFAHALAQELQRLGLPAPVWRNGVLDGAPPVMADTYHPMGGLRMGTDPTISVVDPNLKLHSLANLSIASCAVYPSGGSSNPTFTLMALAMRLADHLNGILTKHP